MYYDATDDQLSKDDILRIEMARAVPSEWKEGKCAAPIYEDDLTARGKYRIGAGTRFQRGTGGYGPYRPDGREKKHGGGTFFRRGKQPVDRRAPSGNRFFCRDSQTRPAPKNIGETVFRSKRDAGVIVAYHIRRLMITFPDLDNDFIVREATRLAHTDVGVWNVDAIKNSRITYPPANTIVRG